MSRSTAAGELFDHLAGSDGLTEHASSFARPRGPGRLGRWAGRAGRAELEELADRFLAERAVSVVADRALEERRWSTPELLAVEQRLVSAATGRTVEKTAVASHQAVRDALAAHPSAGTDQQAMVRDLCQGGQGVAVVVGQAGTGKTFALGIARHAWQLDGYRLLAAAPTGIATISLQGEGFEEVATCDRLLADLDRGRSPSIAGRCWWWMRPVWSAVASWPACSSMPSRPKPRWCWSVMTGSWRRSTPAVASAPFACGSGPANSPRTDGNTRPGNAKPRPGPGRIGRGGCGRLPGP